MLRPDSSTDALQQTHREMCLKRDLIMQACCVCSYARQCEAEGKLQDAMEARIRADALEQLAQNPDGLLWEEQFQRACRVLGEIRSLRRRLFFGTLSPMQTLLSLALLPHSPATAGVSLGFGIMNARHLHALPRYFMSKSMEEYCEGIVRRLEKRGNQALIDLFKAEAGL